MGCNCKETNGFKEKLAEAKRLTAETGELHVIYALDVPRQGKHVFLRKESQLNNNLGICCYFLPDGTEVEYIPRVEQTIEATETIETAESIGVAEPIIVKKKKSKKDI
jgi:hypothetical protein